MDSFHEYKFSVIKLIDAVKVRPVLWDNSRAGFRSHKNKDQEWKEVFEELDANYRFLSQEEQSVVAIKITTKWRNIRDVFIRSVKKRATDPKIKKYMYHDQLTFMLEPYKSYLHKTAPEPFIRPESPEPVPFNKSCNTYLKNFEEKETQRYIFFDNAPENSLDETPPKTSASVEEESLSIKTEPEDNNVEELTYFGTELCANSRNINTDFDDEFERISCSEIQAVQNENDTGELEKDNIQEVKPPELDLNQSFSGRYLENVAVVQPDEDKAFMISILSSLRDMSIDEKLEFRIAVLQKISDIRSNRHNS